MERVGEVEPEKVQVKVKVVRENPNKIPPLIGRFLTGFDPLKDSSSTSFQVYPNTDGLLELVVKPADSPFEFVVTNYSGVEGVKNVLGILDKDSKTLTFVPILGNEIFILDKKIKGWEEAAAADREKLTRPVKKLTPREKALKALQTIEMWGTKKNIKKAKKRLALRLALGIGEEELYSQILKDLELDDEKLDYQTDLELDDEELDSQTDLELDDEELVSPVDLELEMPNVLAKCSGSTKSHVTRKIPPYDASATAPQDVYLLHQIILKGEWRHLDDIYIVLQQEGVAANFNSYPSFIRNRIEKLNKIEDESEKKKLSCIFSYINHLIKFKDRQYSMYDNDDASSSNHQIPDILLYKFTTMFDFSDTKVLSVRGVRLLISYVLVLTLFADEFQTDYRDIAKDLGMRSLDLKLHYENLGCKVSRIENKDSGEQYFCATLPVPLQFPD